VTISKFYRPSGASTQLRGVAADIVLPSTTDFSEFGESTLKDPLPWDVVQSASYVPMGRVQPFLEALRKSSVLRVKSEKDFAYLATDIGRLRKSLISKSVSLNEVERRRELAEEKARTSERQLDRKALEKSSPRTYDITLENVDAPGLPAPAVEQKRIASVVLGDSSDDEARDSAADRDVTLRESERILADYVDLSSHARHATEILHAAR
jgi:carboxyl-terminal processing protease